MDCQVYVLTMSDKQSCDDKEDWIAGFTAITVPTWTLAHVVVLIEMLKLNEAD